MKTTAFLLAGIASLSLASAASAQVFSDGFEGDTPGAPAGALINFTTIGTVDVVGPGNPFDIFVLSNVVDLDGSPGPGEIVSRDEFSFDANQFIDLSFIVGGSQRGGLGDNFFTRLIFSSPTVVSGFGGSGVFETIVPLPLLAFLPGPTTFNTFVAGDAGFTPSSLFFTTNTAGSFRFAFGSNSADNVGPLLDSVTLRGGNGPVGLVPEPTTWAMMITGFGLAGAMLRRRRTIAIRA